MSCPQITAFSSIEIPQRSQCLHFNWERFSNFPNLSYGTIKARLKVFQLVIIFPPLLQQLTHSHIPLSKQLCLPVRDMNANQRLKLGCTSLTSMELVHNKGPIKCFRYNWIKSLKYQIKTILLIQEILNFRRGPSH